MEDILGKSISSVVNAEMSITKFITANDVGATGGHQSGFYIHRHNWPFLFDSKGVRGMNKDRFVTIRWQDDIETNSRFVYYGVRTRNEYRITRFGKSFPFLQDDNIGDLLIMSKVSDDYYEAYVLNADEDIDYFVNYFNLSNADINGIIPDALRVTPKSALEVCFFDFISSLSIDFPTTTILATNARECYNKVFEITENIIRSNPSKQLLGWLDAEFKLFKALEHDRYKDLIKGPFRNVESFVEIANTILNRRKSRAGHSLEHHLSEIFNTYSLMFSSQATTEGRKKPDFIFPGSDAYLDPSYDDEKLIMLASKTTCKDRWRQILNEADRIKTKHLFTLQQGISKNQLSEMYKSNVCLVVPKPYISSFPKEYRDKIQSLDQFITFAKGLQ